MSRAFVCEDETALAAYRRTDASIKQWRVDFMDACKQLGSEGGYAHISGDGIYVIGIQRCNPAPAGWRWTPSRKSMRPIQGAEGAPARNWLKEWSGHKSGDAVLTSKFGMPATSHSPRTADGRSWMHWSSAGDVGDRLLVMCRYDDVDKYNADLWREIKLSEYHAAIEAAGAVAGA